MKILSDVNVLAELQEKGFDVLTKADLDNLYFYGKANATITKGQAVMFAGAEGDHALLAPATQAAINANASLIIGIAEADMVQGDFGYIIIFGRLILDTTDWDVGDILWFDSAGVTAGALTTTEPTGTNAKIQMAAVTRDHQNEGRIVIRTTIFSTRVSDIDASGTPSNATFLRGDGAWAQTIASISVGTTAPTSPVDGQMWWDDSDGTLYVYYNDGTSSQWVSAAPSAYFDDIVLKTINGEALEGTGNIVITPATIGAAQDVHTHLEADITDLDKYTQTQVDTLLAGKADASHTHAISDVTNLQTTLDAKATPADITAAIDNLVAAAPGALDTLDELAAALGDDPNFATTVTNSLAGKANNTITITGTNGLTGGGDLTADRTISHADTSTQGSVNNSGTTFIQDVTLDGFGHVTGLSSATAVIPTVNDATLTVQGSNGLTGSGTFTANQGTNATITISHADTSSQASVDNSNGTVIQDITLDGSGHVTALGSIDLDGRYYTESEVDSLLGGKADLSHTHTIGYYSSDATSDLNNLYSTGQFGFGPSTAGRPEDFGQGINIVSVGTAHNNANNWITQLAFGTAGNTGYFRTKVNAGGWGSWHTLYHTGNLTPSDYVAKSGGTMTGTLTVDNPTSAYNSFVATNGTQNISMGVNNSEGVFIFGNTNHDLRFGTNSSEKVRIKANGNVGIGTTSPAVKLHTISNNTDYQAKFQHDGTTTGYAPGSILLEAGQANSRGQGIYHYNTVADENWFTGVPYAVDSKKWIVANQYGTSQLVDTAQLQFALLTIDSDTGNVGIGTSSPRTKLNVASSTSASVTPTLGSANNSSAIFTNSVNAYGLNVMPSGSGDVHLQVQRFDGSTSVYDLNLQPSGGNVGIGTTSPSSKLFVNGNTVIQSTGDALVVKGTTTGGVNINPWGTSTNIDPNDANGTIYFGRDSALANLIVQSGNVGIGTTSPDSKLQVNGAIKISDVNDFNIGYFNSIQDGYINLNYNNHADTLIGTNMKLNADHDVITVNTHPSLRGSAIVFAGNGHPNGENTINFYSKPSGSAAAGTIYTAESAEMVLKQSNLYLGETSGLGANTTKGLFVNSASYVAGGQVTELLGKWMSRASDNNGTGGVGIEYYRVPRGGGVQSGTEIRFYTGYTYTPQTTAERMRIDQSGNVGIGTLSPGTRLDVVGNIRVSAEQTMTSTAQFPKLDMTGHSGAANYNYLLRGWNDTGAKAIHFVNGSTRTADGGTNTYTIRNDGGVLRLGSSSYETRFDGTITLLRGGTEYSNYIRSQNYPSKGYTGDGKYWIEYGARGGHHFVVDTDGGTAGATNSFDNFTIWKGAVDGPALLQVNNGGDTTVAGTFTATGGIQNATATVSGGVKMRVDGTTLYIRNDGTNA